MEYGLQIETDYASFIKKFIEKGYTPVFFNELSSNTNQLIIRHDIDFDCELAYQIAITESKLNIKATYFFLVSNDSYNIFSKSNAEYINLIKNLGHKISIHFDPLVYNDYNGGLRKEIRLFEDFFNEKISIISLHRPNQFFLEFDKKINNIEHTYQNKYFKNVKYFADSTGIWRYGNPLNSTEFENNASIHLLIHPIWWETSGYLNTEKAKTHFFKKISDIKSHYSRNCKPFLDIKHEL